MPDTTPVPAPEWLDRTALSTYSTGPFPLSVSMLSWAYNEEENITGFLAAAQSFMNSLNVEYEHILIDDGSMDRTFELASAFAPTYPQLRLIKNETNLGSGWCTRIAISNASKAVCFWQTVDWSYDISQLNEYLWSLRYFDVVHGVRIRSQPHHFRLLNILPFTRNVQVAKRSDNLSKAIISVVNYMLIRLLFRIPLLDFQNVTIYPTKLAQSIECETHSSFIVSELLFKSHWKGASILQVPIDFIPRKLGVSNGTRLRPIVRAVCQILQYWVRWQVLGLRPDHGTGVIEQPSVVTSAAQRRPVASGA